MRISDWSSDWCSSDLRDDLKLTAGFRYTEDRKTFTPVPSQVLLARSLIGGGTVSAGYPEDLPIKQKWGEWTGRIGLDWKPDVGFKIGRGNVRTPVPNAQLVCRLLLEKKHNAYISLSH